MWSIVVSQLPRKIRLISKQLPVTLVILACTSLKNGVSQTSLEETLSEPYFTIVTITPPPTPEDTTTTGYVRPSIKEIAGTNVLTFRYNFVNRTYQGLSSKIISLKPKECIIVINTESRTLVIDSEKEHLDCDLWTIDSAGDYLIISATTKHEQIEVNLVIDKAENVAFVNVREEYPFEKYLVLANKSAL